jgi:hypothetical protein
MANSRRVDHIDGDMRQLFRATCPCKIFMSLLQALMAHSLCSFWLARFPVFIVSSGSVDSLAQWQVGDCLGPDFLGPYTMNSCLNEVPIWVNLLRDGRTEHLSRNRGRPAHLRTLFVCRESPRGVGFEVEGGGGGGGAAAVEMEKKVVVKSEECRGWHTVD